MVTVSIVIIDFMRLHINGVKEGFILFFGSFLRRHEFTRLSGATYLLLGCLLTSFLYRKPVVIAACAFVIVGDTFAAVLGANIKGPRIFRKKSLLGSVGFFVSSMVVVWVLASLPGSLPVQSLIIGAVAGTIIEALPLPWDDNFSIPIITGAIMSLV